MPVTFNSCGKLQALPSRVWSTVCLIPFSSVRVCVSSHSERANEDGTDDGLAGRVALCDAFARFVAILLTAVDGVADHKERNQDDEGQAANCESLQHQPG